MAKRKKKTVDVAIEDNIAINDNTKVEKAETSADIIIDEPVVANDGFIEETKKESKVKEPKVTKKTKVEKAVANDGIVEEKKEVKYVKHTIGGRYSV